MEIGEGHRNLPGTQQANQNGNSFGKIRITFQQLDITDFAIFCEEKAMAAVLLNPEEMLSTFTLGLNHQKPQLTKSGTLLSCFIGAPTVGDRQ
jgi:hypothetical protein